MIRFDLFKVCHSPFSFILVVLFAVYYLVFDIFLDYLFLIIFIILLEEARSRASEASHARR